jgi:hypothetical protein
MGTVRLANEIRETSMPVYCSACFNQANIRHVDFDAACDRGYANAEAVEVSMDELVLCENCVKNGAAILGIEDSKQLKTELDDAEMALKRERKEREQAQRYASTLEDAVHQKGVKLDHRQKPRQLREVQDA